VVPVEPDKDIGSIPLSVLTHNKSSVSFKKNSPTNKSVGIIWFNVTALTGGTVGTSPV